MPPELAAEFPDVQVQVNIAGSGTLVNQIATRTADAVLLAGAIKWIACNGHRISAPSTIARNTSQLLSSRRTGGEHYFQIFKIPDCRAL